MTIQILPPGYRFNPTDKELLLFYLKNQLLGKNLTIVNKVIPEVDIYKSSPQDISVECFKGRDQHGYFFCHHERKFASSFRKRRSTNTGQWRTTGKDKQIKHKSKTVGMKRTLVFYSTQTGKTNWVIYEYSLCDQQLGTSGSAKNDCVLCKLLKKNSSNPSNDEHCAVEDWEDAAYSDDNAFFPYLFNTGGSEPDKPCSSMDTMEERLSCRPGGINFTFDFSAVTSQEATDHSEAVSSHETNGQQDSSFSFNNNCEVDADIGIAAVMHPFNQTPAIHWSSECDKFAIDPKEISLNYPTNDNAACSSQREITIPILSSNHFSELTPEFEANGSYKDTSTDFSIKELCYIVPQWSPCMEFDQHQQQYEDKFMCNAFVGGINPYPDLLGYVNSNLESGTAAASGGDLVHVPLPNYQLCGINPSPNLLGDVNSNLEGTTAAASGW